MTVLELLEKIALNMQRDCIDYIAIFAPVVLSVVAIAITLVNSFWTPAIKRIDANIVWDDLHSDFYIIIRNTGKKTVIIDSIYLQLVQPQKWNNIKLGTRNNVWSTDDKCSYIKENEAMVIKPYYASNYDIFSYRAHIIDVNEQNKNYKVQLVVADIDKKEWKFNTPFTFGELDKCVECALI